MEARRMSYFCDIRLDNHVNSRVLYTLPRGRYLEVRGLFKGCKAGARECPRKCWNAGKGALKKQHVLNHMCRYYNTVAPPKGIKLIGYVKISNCGTHKSYRYAKKLCCYKAVIPIFPPKVIRYGYLC